jgi:hypothetical protein
VTVALPPLTTPPLVAPLVVPAPGPLVTAPLVPAPPLVTLLVPSDEKPEKVDTDCAETELMAASDTGADSEGALCSGGCEPICVSEGGCVGTCGFACMPMPAAPTLAPDMTTGADAEAVAGAATWALGVTEAAKATVGGGGVARESAPAGDTWALWTALEMALLTPLLLVVKPAKPRKAPVPEPRPVRDPAAKLGATKPEPGLLPGPEPEPGAMATAAAGGSGPDPEPVRA